MKKIFLLTSLCVVTFYANSQILKKITDKVKNKIDPTVNKPVSDTTTVKKDEKAPTVDTSKTQQTAVGIKAYSKYDFIPGEKIIVFEDFAQDAVGDFPDKWNTNASAEIVTIESLQGKWLKISKQGVFMPEFIDSLPDNFTLEYDLLCDNPGKVWSFYSSLTKLTDRGHPEHWQSEDNRFTFTIAPYPDGNSNS